MKRNRIEVFRQRADQKTPGHTSSQDATLMVLCEILEVLDTHTELLETIAGKETSPKSSVPSAPEAQTVRRRGGWIKRLFIHKRLT